MNYNVPAPPPPPQPATINPVCQDRGFGNNITPQEMTLTQETLNLPYGRVLHK